jgi:tetratricopeptide (TPR) repeat protein
MTAVRGVFLIFLVSISHAAPFILTADPLIKTRLLFSEGKYNQAVFTLSDSFLQTLKNKNLSEAYWILAASEELSGHGDRALGVYQVATNIFPKDRDLLINFARLLHRSGLDEQAEPLFEKVLSLHPDDVEAHLGLAEIDSSLGLLDQSALHYETALEKSPKGAETWKDYSEVLLRMGDAESAEPEIAHALSISPSFEALVLAAQIAHSRGHMDQAFNRLDKAFELESSAEKHTALRALKALWLIEEGKGDQAALLAETTLKTEPRDPLALWIKARVELGRGRNQDALKDLRLAAQDDENSFISSVCKAMIKNLAPKER